MKVASALEGLTLNRGQKPPYNINEIFYAKEYLEIDLKEKCWDGLYILTLCQIHCKMFIDSLVNVKDIMDPDNNSWRNSQVSMG